MGLETVREKACGDTLDCQMLLDIQRSSTDIIRAGQDSYHIHHVFHRILLGGRAPVDDAYIADTGWSVFDHQDAGVSGHPVIVGSCHAESTDEVSGCRQVNVVAPTIQMLRLSRYGAASH